MARNTFTNKIYRLLLIGMFFSNGALRAEDNPSTTEVNDPAAAKIVAEQDKSLPDQNGKTVPAEIAKQEKSTTAKISPEQEALYWRALGHVIARNSNLMGLGIAAEDFDKIIAGMREAVINRQSLQTLTEQQSNDMQNFFMNKEKEQIENTKKLGETFLKAKKTEPGFVTTESGLCYKIIVPGDAVRANDDCSVEIDYEGKLIDGTVFDSSFERKEHASFYLGMVIPGFREALKLIGNNGEIQVFIPSNLAYGDENMGPIPGGSVLEFKIKLYKVTSPDVDEKK